MHVHQQVWHIISSVLLASKWDASHPAQLPDCTVRLYDDYTVIVDGYDDVCTLVEAKWLFTG